MKKGHISDALQKSSVHIKITLQKIDEGGGGTYIVVFVIFLKDLNILIFELIQSLDLLMVKKD